MTSAHPALEAIRAVIDYNAAVYGKPREKNISALEFMQMTESARAALATALRLLAKAIEQRDALHNDLHYALGTGSTRIYEEQRSNLNAALDAILADGAREGGDGA